MWRRDRPDQGEGAPDRRRRIRLALAGAILLAAAVGAALLLRRPEAPVATPEAVDARVVFVDVAGWYVRTPDEVAALTPLDLSLGGLPGGLPLDLGGWRGVDRPHDPAVDRWLRRPEISIERTYQRPDGEVVWMSAFGSTGRRSFHLFEHTPDTCYPLGGWRIERIDLARLPLGPLPLTVNRGVASGPDGRLVFAWLYVWDSPERDAERGVLSMRLSSPVRTDDETTWAMLAGDFVPRLFSGTLSWTRF